MKSLFFVILNNLKNLELSKPLIFENPNPKNAPNRIDTKGKKRYNYIVKGSWQKSPNYWLERNLQGDVVAIYNNSGTKLATYTYDAWGNHNLTYYNGGAGVPAVSNNLFRYRGYKPWAPRWSEWYIDLWR